MKRRLPAAFYNPLSIFGMSLAGLMLLMILFLIAVDATSGLTNSYLGLLTYIALPGVMLFGLFVALIGVIITRRRVLKGLPEKVLPILDLNKPKHRAVLSSLLVGGTFLVVMSGYGSYHAYEYTESVQFCGTTCHTIMKPEYTAYQASPHAKVPCVGCHIGNGASYFVKSKLSGAYQVYSTLFHKYSRPVETPIHNLRPAKETCEECHWPKKFYGEVLQNHTFYQSDEGNSRWDIAMLVKIGGGEGYASGIHAHMYLDAQIGYISTDRKRQVIPYVEERMPDGSVTVFRDKANPATEEQLKKGEHRTIDCIDCHNRPTHIFRPADVSVDSAMAASEIDASLPNIKSKGVEVLEKHYGSTDAALKAIGDEITSYYRKQYSQISSTKSAQIGGAVAQLQLIYSQNYFPEMKSDWRAYPDNLDHMHSSGCFRCHDGNHVSDKGKVISHNCKSCHVILAQGPPGKVEQGPLTGLTFHHPVDVGDAWQTTMCKDCHGPDAESANSGG